jgi:hypothetical protein
MSLTSDQHTIEIEGHTVTVTGRTGPVHATWTLLVDDVEIDSAKAAGDFRLKGALPGGGEVAADVHQSLLGPTKVTFHHGERELETSTGYVA